MSENKETLKDLLKAYIKREIKSEVNPVVKTEVTNNLLDKLKSDIKNELRSELIPEILDELRQEVGMGSSVAINTEVNTSDANVSTTCAEDITQTLVPKVEANNECMDQSVDSDVEIIEAEVTAGTVAPEVVTIDDDMNEDMNANAETTAQEITESVPNRCEISGQTSGGSLMTHMTEPDMDTTVEDMSESIDPEVNTRPDVPLMTTTVTRVVNDSFVTEIFTKDSFGRFSDDLCQHLLSFMTLEDRFRCECVSKQWQKVIYRSQRQLIINDKFDYHLTDQSFESMLKKCRNLAAIEIKGQKFRLTDPMLISIIKHCDLLKAINITFLADISAKTWDQFFRRFCQLLSSIEMRLNCENSVQIMPTIKESLKKCERLSCLRITTRQRSYQIFNSCLITNQRLTADWLKNLRSFSFICNNECIGRFERFVDHYSEQLRTFEVKFDKRCTKQTIDIVSTAVGRMQGLIDLTFNMAFVKETMMADMVNSLVVIGRQCRRLKALTIDYYAHTCYFFAIIFGVVNEYFNGIKRLRIKADFQPAMTLFSPWLDRCRRLTHLTLESDLKCQIDDKFLLDIDLYLPRLESLSLDGLMVLWDDSMASVAKLSALREVRLLARHLQFGTDVMVEILRANCPKITTIAIEEHVVYDNFRVKILSRNGRQSHNWPSVPRNFQEDPDSDMITRLY